MVLHSLLLTSNLHGQGQVFFIVDQESSTQNVGMEISVWYQVWCLNPQNYQGDGDNTTQKRHLYMHSFLYFQQQVCASQSISEERWRHEHPIQARSLVPTVAPRRRLPLAEHQSQSQPAHIWDSPAGTTGSHSPLPYGGPSGSKEHKSLHIEATDAAH